MGSIPTMTCSALEVWQWTFGSRTVGPRLVNNSAGPRRGVTGRGTAAT